MDESFQAVVDYLKEKAGGKLLMSSEQLAEELGISTKQQSKLRKENAFPIPHKSIGRLVYYSVYDVAKFLVSKDTLPPTKFEKTLLSSTVPEPRNDTKKRQIRGVQDLSFLAKMT
ncbi:MULTISPECIES: helix-turn-helix domain-containing protein [Burkholderia cepacia complex]|uniref:helix-turn-helix domain-containing protein n=1 Tax=Burkholderia cepacia complex TaxID=87882 RepID=UPI001CF21F07|nr:MULTISPECIES: helix-turn-helix domain-containing protein [Burkholderia cepacia complex]MCA7983694.1 helix-turn-helix domain-containing protein [Burkholderia vietnamiensis]